MGINGPWITKSYLELILDRKGQWHWLNIHLNLFGFVQFGHFIGSKWCHFNFLNQSTPHAGVPRLNTPPLITSTPVTSTQEKGIAAPRPIRTTPNYVTRLEDLSQPWTRSPTKSKMEPVLATWHFMSDTAAVGGSLFSGHYQFTDHIITCKLQLEYN